MKYSRLSWRSTFKLNTLYMQLYIQVTEGKAQNKIGLSKFPTLMSAVWNHVQGRIPF
jgi:hypothetical protein